jgi:hypothetical protein
MHDLIFATNLALILLISIILYFYTISKFHQELKNNYINLSILSYDIIEENSYFISYFNKRIK